jgi:hypothetical protein
LISEVLYNTLGHDGLREEFTAEELGVSEEEAHTRSYSGFLTHDEAAILYHIVQRSGGHWLDIGGAVGWSAAHIEAAAGIAPTSIDLRYDNPRYLERRLMNNKGRCVAGHSSRVLYEMINKPPRHFYTGALVDGCHEHPVPLTDAVQCAMLGVSVVVLHDFFGAIAPAAKWLIDHAGYSCKIYNTPHLMAVCWELGVGFDPPEHKPDLSIDWRKERGPLHKRYPWTMEY